ncbi:hypothetical protein [Natranaerofaba carboxydovora]|uniref:hypothetical protein n=1 Tax=Natranaerofaba carboxydovora TaxID=2742683 RepID=UPI001F12F13F|nr:hypothetical protein [Natranaerofaba carboxydovora]UMZ75171.1 Colicin V production protein [Natranaerofaba carboxydovora]
MNIIDIIIIGAIAWQGIWGYLKGVKTVISGLLGLLISFGITAKAHSYIASGISPVMSSYLKPYFKSLGYDLSVNTTILEEFNLSTEVIDYWFLKEDYKEVLGFDINSQSAGETIYELDLFIFLLANLVSFLIFFWTLNFFSKAVSDMIFRKNLNSQTADSYSGLLLGMVQGFTVCSLYVFLLVLLITVNFPHYFVTELYNSKLAMIMLEAVSYLWVVFSAGG